MFVGIDDCLKNHLSCVYVFIVPDSHLHIYSDTVFGSKIDDIVIDNRAIWDDCSVIIQSSERGIKNTDFCYMSFYSLNIDEIIYFVWLEKKDEYSTSEIRQRTL